MIRRFTFMGWRTRFGLGRKVFRADERAEIQPEEIFMDSVNLPGFRHEMQEGRIERPVGRGALIALGSVLALAFAVAAWRLADLQLIHGRAFFVQAQANKTYPIFISPPRGIFYDRNLAPLVENTPTFVISLDTEAFADDAAFMRSLSSVGRLADKSVGELAELNGVAGGDAGGELLVRRADWPAEVFVASGALLTEALAIQSRPEEFPGASVSERIRRSYPLGWRAGHLVGYVGRPNREELASASREHPADLIGKTGLELEYDAFLRGTAGRKLIEVNAAGERMRERFIIRAEPGGDVILEIDADLQRFAAQTLARHLAALGKRAGAVVALDPRDGAVRALVSFPAFDPDLFGGGVSRAEIARVLADPADPLFNRAIAGGYPSGSTIKPILASAALEEQIIDPLRQIYDPGYISVPNPYDPANPSIFKDWKALGWVDMRRALALSANVYFYTIGGGYGGIAGLGIERIGSWLERFGWGSELGIDLPGEYRGLIPSPEKKKTIRPKDPVWRLGDTYITAIGQGDLQATPLQLAASTAAIANGGTLWKPRVARSVVDAERRPLKEFAPEAIRRGLLRPESLAVVREGMRQAVTEGSASLLRDLFFPVAGKTGTAQTGVYGKNHGWFVGFAPYGEPEIAIAVLVEEGTGGSTDAVPIAKEILYHYFIVSHSPPLTADESPI